MLGNNYLGATIGKVIKNSPAQKAGLMVNDEIIRINNTTIKIWNDLSKIIKKSKTNLKVYVKRDNKIKVFIPAYRVDVFGEIDIAEEVAIAYGYNKFSGEYPAIGTIGELNPLEKKCDFIRDIMVGFGFYEVINLMLSNDEVLFKKMRIEDDDYIEVLKPASIEHRIVRKSILPLIMETLSINKHKELPQKIFEIGDCVVIDENSETRAKTIKKIAGVIVDNETNFNEIKSYVGIVKRT